MATGIDLARRLVWFSLWQESLALGFGKLFFYSVRSCPILLRTDSQSICFIYWFSCLLLFVAGVSFLLYFNWFIICVWNASGFLLFLISRSCCLSLHKQLQPGLQWFLLLLSPPLFCFEKNTVAFQHWRIKARFLDFLKKPIVSWDLLHRNPWGLNDSAGTGRTQEALVTEGERTVPSPVGRERLAVS